MKAETRVPKEIEAIVTAERQRQEAERKAKEKKEAKNRREKIALGCKLAQEAVELIIQEIPEWMKPYLEAERYNEEELYRLGMGWMKPDRYPMFKIPGLAPILFKPDDGGQFMAAHSWWNDWIDDAEPEMAFRNDSSWNQCLETILVEAADEFQRHQERLGELEKRKAERMERIQWDEKYQQQAEERQAQAAKKEQEEAESLLSALRNDPAAVFLLKAFLAIQQTKRMFEERISEMDDSLISMEERWSRRADELRREAAEAEWRAEDERRKASDLQDDLDQAEKKVKQLKRECRS